MTSVQLWSLLPFDYTTTERPSHLGFTLRCYLRNPELGAQIQAAATFSTDVSGEDICAKKKKKKGRQQLVAAAITTLAFGTSQAQCGILASVPDDGTSVSLDFETISPESQCSAPKSRGFKENQ